MLAARRSSERGFGLVEILIALAVVAVAGYLLMQYFGATARTVEQLQRDRPTDRARLTADRMTLSSLQAAVRTYQAEKGHWPPDKATVLSLLAPRPTFQCPGNDLEYDPASGVLSLTIADESRC